LVVDTEVLGVPAGERVGVTGAKEHAAEADNSFHELLRVVGLLASAGTPAVLLSVIPPGNTTRNETPPAGRRI
jgi:hypothetical protein